MLRFFFKVFKSFLELFKHGLFGDKKGTQQYSVHLIVLKWLESKTIVICLKLHARLRTLSHKVVQTWFVLHKTWHPTLFSLCYCVEMVRLENNSHVLEITC